MNVDLYINLGLRKFIYFIFLIFGLGAVGASAQNSFSGVVLDTEKEALPGTQVLLLVEDSLYTGTLTDDSGRFSLKNINADKYQLRIFYPGFTPIDEERVIRGNQDFEFILVKAMSAELDAVEVIGNQGDFVRRTATGQIFKLSEQAKNSGDPYRALSEIPRLNINEGLRTVFMEDGSSPLILINGMTVNTGITPIDPKDIESVEVMDVLSARHLRSGARNIINIKLKEKRSRYTFFEIMNRNDIPWRNGMGAIYFEIGNSRYSFYGRGTGNYIYDDNVKTAGWQQSDTYFKKNEGKDRNDSHYFLGELLFKWMFTPKDYLAVHIYGKSDDARSKSHGEGLFRTVNEELFYYTSQKQNKSTIWTGSLYHRHAFSKNELLETTFAYNYNKNSNEGESSENYSDWLYHYFYKYKNRRLSGTLTFDYSKDWNDINSLNIGSETKYTNDHIRSISENIPTFFHREWNTYLYASFSSKVDKLNYMGSLGFEGIWLKAGKVSDGYIRPRASISGTFTYNINHSTSVSYTLTNTAPQVNQLNPYNTSTDSLIITRGSPSLYPMQQNRFRFSHTFNKSGLYITPRVDYSLYTDIIEPYGYSENGIYISSYRNRGKYQTLSAGGNLNYRIRNWGRINFSASHLVDYFSEQDPMKSFSIYASMNVRLKKWFFFIDCQYRNYSYSAISRTINHVPIYSLAQIQYYFTPNFYASIGLQYYTGSVMRDHYTYGENYNSFRSEKMTDMNLRPWILIRYTLRKNEKQKINLNNILTGKESGIAL